MKDYPGTDLMAPIDTYKDRADRQLETWRRGLRTSQSTTPVAIAYYCWKLMSEDLKTPEKLLKIFETSYVDPKTGLHGADLWRFKTLEISTLEFDSAASPDDPDGSKWLRRQEEYLRFGEKLVRDKGVRTHYTEDRANGVGYLIRENPEFPKYFQVIADEFIRWSRKQRRTSLFLLMSAETAYGQFLSERKDIVAMLREAQLLPLDVEHTEVDIPAAVEIAEAVIGLIPVVGSMTAAYEAYTGQNLFGYHLTDVERAILGATVLLPVAGRLVREGRILYTEAKLVRLYGRDASSWGKALSKSTGLLRDAKAITTLQKAEAVIKAGGRLDAALAKEASSAIRFLTESATISRAVDQKVLDGLTSIRQLHAVFAELDEFAMERVLMKGPTLSHLKGQLLEELLESRIVTGLAERAGSFALGLEAPVGRQLEFIPGYLIRDLEGRQITDGILAYRENGVLNVLAVFEAKAGPKAARELSFARASISDLTGAEKTELRAFAKDTFREQRSLATAGGKPYTKTLEQVEREMVQSERGGQIRRDIERLTKDYKINVGFQTLPITFSPTKTKFFALVPNDLSSRGLATIRAELAAENVTFEVIDAGVSTKQLDNAASSLSSLAANFVDGAVAAPGLPPTPWHPPLPLPE